MKEEEEKYGGTMSAVKRLSNTRKTLAGSGGSMGKNSGEKPSSNSNSKNRKVANMNEDGSVQSALPRKNYQVREAQEHLL